MKMPMNAKPSAVHTADENGSMGSNNPLLRLMEWNQLHQVNDFWAVSNDSSQFTLVLGKDKKLRYVKWEWKSREKGTHDAIDKMHQLQCPHDALQLLQVHHRQCSYLLWCPNRRLHLKCCVNIRHSCDRIELNFDGDTFSNHNSNSTSIASTLYHCTLINVRRFGTCITA